MSFKIEIRIVGENADNQSWSFDGSRPIRVRRVSENKMILEDGIATVGGGHDATIRLENGVPTIFDNRSVPGLFAADKRVDWARLENGSVFRIGADGPALAVSLEGDAASATTVQAPKSDTKKYGERTVGLMIRQALVQAGLFKSEGTSKSTTYFENLVEERVRRTGAKMGWFIAIVALLLVAGGTALGVYLYRNRSVQYIHQTNVAYGEAVGSQVAAANRYAVFLMAGLQGEGGTYQGFCTAFALSADVLATNAHCVQSALTAYQSPVVMMNGAPANVYPIVRAVHHAGFQAGRISMDVGLIRIRGVLPYMVMPATNEELAQLSPGLPVFLYGFPGRLNNVAAPEATFVTGEIGRVTALDQSPRTFSENILIQHSAYTSSGTSGSPLFNGAGHVVGINTGGYTENGQVLAGYNFGLRIDAVYSLLQSI